MSTFRYLRARIPNKRYSTEQSLFTLPDSSHKMTLLNVPYSSAQRDNRDNRLVLAPLLDSLPYVHNHP